MDIGPILRTLFRNKTRFILITLEVALTLAIVVNCINMMLDMKNQMDRPTGLDEENIIVVWSHPFMADFKEDGYFKNATRADLEMIRNIPGVIAADAFNHIPLSGSGSSSGWKPLGSEMNTLAANYFDTGTQGVDVLGIKLIQGRNFTLNDINESKSKNVIITKAFADKLFPEGNALGQQIHGRSPDNPDTIIGIIEKMHGSWPMWPHVENVLLNPGEPGSFNWGNRYMVRVEEGRINPIVVDLEKKLLDLNNGRNVRIETLAEVKADTFRGNIEIIKLIMAVIVLLIFVTSLGIVGITSFSVTERTHHIGTRRALGARRFDILRYFLTENWLITTSGIVLGVAFTYGLNYVLVNFISGAKLDWRLLAAGLIGMWIIGLLAAFFPALRGSRISPAVATRNV
jgi:putative ABC transport system permease protein